MPTEISTRSFIGRHNSDLQQTHLEAGMSMPKGRTVFIDESCVGNYLTGNSSCTILLNVGEKQLAAVHGFDKAVNEFDKIAQTNLDSHPLLRRFQAAAPFRGHYTDPYSDVQSGLVGDKLSFRLQIISGLIRAVENRDPHETQQLRRLRHSLQFGFNFDGLRVEYGNPRDNIADEIPSCVNGLVGTVREAAIAYEADPNIEIIGLYTYLKSSISAKLGLPPVHMGQIVKGITVKVHDREDHDEMKLLVDGVLADNYLEDILGLDWMPYMAIGLLEYAQSRGIRRVIINTGNSGSHESANAFQYFIATKYSGLQPDRDFTFDLDPNTGNHLFRLKSHHMKKVEDGFLYTHYLEKDSMPEEMIHTLAASDIYQGESYLETWYSWMVHIHNRIDAWDSELKARFPYAELRDPIMKPSWNLGRGPMVGMELDVNSVLPNLCQQYL